MNQADPPSSATPSVPIHPPRYCDPINRPSRARSLGRGQDCSLIPPPSLASPLPGCTFPPIRSLSGLCQSNEQSLNSSTARKQMELRDNLQHTQKESEGGKRAAMVKKKKGGGRDYQMHSQNVPLAGELKLCLRFAHFSNLSLIELRFQTAGRLSGCSRGRRERVREIHVSEERLNLCNFS